MGLEDGGFADLTFGYSVCIVVYMSRMRGIAMSGAPKNVIDVQFGKRESFNEFSARFAEELKEKKFQPDAEIERSALLAVAEGRLDDAMRLGDVLSRRNQLGIARMK